MQDNNSQNTEARNRERKFSADLLVRRNQMEVLRESEEELSAEKLRLKIEEQRILKESEELGKDEKQLQRKIYELGTDIKYLERKQQEAQEDLRRAS